MSNNNAFVNKVRNAGFYCYEYQNRDERFSSFVPNCSRVLCCLPTAAKTSLEPIGLALIVYPGETYSIAYSLGGTPYLCGASTDIPNLIIDALSKSSEEPESQIDPEVVTKHGVHLVGVFSVLRRTSASELEVALANAIPFALDELLTDIRTLNTVNLDLSEPGFVKLRVEDIFAIGKVDHQSKATKWEIVLVGEPNAVEISNPGRVLLHSLSLLRGWSVFETVGSNKVFDTASERPKVFPGDVENVKRLAGISRELASRIDQLLLTETASKLRVLFASIAPHPVHNEIAGKVIEQIDEIERLGIGLTESARGHFASQLDVLYRSSLRELD